MKRIILVVVLGGLCLSCGGCSFFFGGLRGGSERSSGEVMMAPAEPVIISEFDQVIFATLGVGIVTEAYSHEYGRWPEHQEELWFFVDEVGLPRDFVIWCRDISFEPQADGGLRVECHILAALSNVDLPGYADKQTSITLPPPEDDARRNYRRWRAEGSLNRYPLMAMLNRCKPNGKTPD